MRPKDIAACYDGRYFQPLYGPLFDLLYARYTHALWGVLR